MKFPASYRLQLLAAARDHERDGHTDDAATMRKLAPRVTDRTLLHVALELCVPEWDTATLVAHLDTADARARGETCESGAHLRGPAVDPWQCPSCGAVYCRACEAEGPDCVACSQPVADAVPGMGA